MTRLSNIGVAGLAVMGENLVLNMESKGFSVSVFNRTSSKVDAFMGGRAKDKNINGFYSVEEFVGSLERPRKVMMMVKAGTVVDDFIQQLLPYLEEGDIVIDGGNSNYHDTQRRAAYLEEKGLLFIGTGVSGGEEGALKGPSIMPGGSFAAWKEMEPILVPISAKLEDSTFCCSWMGKGGAGHFVKMVHNGIEYGDMQLICESYHIMKDVLQMSADEIHQVFLRWNEGELSSYLIEITRDIMAYKDEGEIPLIDNILDTAGQKGTGKWTVIAALDAGIPLSLISESVFSRCLSAQKEERVAASSSLAGPDAEFTGDKEAFLDELEKALYLAKIISYTQGFNLLQEASAEYGWDLNYGEIARIWRGGCIIRSVFLSNITEAYQENPNLNNLLLAPYFKNKVQQAQQSLRNILATAVKHGIPAPCHSSALNYYDGFRTARLPANLLQAQRDYFGAHTYERIDKPRGEFFHTNWTGEGGDTTSTAYTR
jgi:6-phosphogluconate dehydrogenase